MQLVPTNTKSSMKNRNQRISDRESPIQQKRAAVRILVRNISISAYKKYMQPLPIFGHRLDYARVEVNESATPKSRGEATAAIEAKVWVNTSSGKHFRPGQQRYGKTKRDEYTSEAEAIRRGYRAAKGG